MAIQRTVQDVYALAVPQTPLEDTYEEGDEVTVQHRESRLVDLGWIQEEPVDEKAHLTFTGAAILTFFSEMRRQGRLGEELERGAGNFVERAVKYAQRNVADHWDVIQVNEDEVVIRSDEGEEREYSRGGAGDEERQAATA